MNLKFAFGLLTITTGIGCVAGWLEYRRHDPEQWQRDFEAIAEREAHAIRDKDTLSFNWPIQIIVTPEEEAAMRASDKIICPECARQGTKSTVHEVRCYTNLVYCTPYYFNEDGIRIQNKCPKTSWCEYRCSNNHTWSM